MWPLYGLVPENIREDDRGVLSLPVVETPNVFIFKHTSSTNASLGIRVLFGTATLAMHRLVHCLQDGLSDKTPKKQKGKKKGFMGTMVEFALGTDG